MTETADMITVLFEAERLAREVKTLNPASGELGEGKARNLIEMAERLLKMMEDMA
jgi:hypothetical protein